MSHWLEPSQVAHLCGVSVTCVASQQHCVATPLRIKATLALGRFRNALPEIEIRSRSGNVGFARPLQKRLGMEAPLQLEPAALRSPQRRVSSQISAPPLDEAQRRTLNVVVAMVGIVISLPVMLIIAL